MPRLPRLQDAGFLHHVICKANDPLVLFSSSSDYKKYIDLINEARILYPINIYNYVLMDTHVHLLLEPREEGSLSKFMEHVSKGYAKYFNKKYNRSGHVFQGRFKSFLVQEERYFFTCSRYIDLNPVKAKMVSDAKQYLWSGFGTLAHGKKSALKLDTHSIYKELGANAIERQIAYKTLVLRHQGEEFDFINKRAAILGDTDFKNKFK